jgi:hypothetical protein
MFASFLHRFRGNSSYWPWLAAFLPGIAILSMLWPLRVPLPYLDGWSFVQQYQRWAEGGYSWQEFFSPHYVHQSAIGKIVYFAVLHLFGGNMALLPVGTWLLAAIIVACVCRLSCDLWRDRPLWAALLMLLTGLTVFSAAQGEVWIWGFLFQNSIPGMCLAVGLVILSAGTLSTWRLMVAGVLVVLANFSFGSGPLVGMLLALPIWHAMDGRSMARRCAAAGAWLVFAGLVTWLALRTLNDEDVTGLKILLDRPLMRLQFTLILLGQMLGKGTVFEPQMLCTLIGGALLIAFLACSVHVARRRADRALVAAALPWIVFGLFGIGTALLICIGRSFNSLANSLEERYSALTLFFIFGTLLLLAVVVRHSGSRLAWLRGLRMAAVPAATVLLVAHALNWERGYQGMKLKYVAMQQERAMLAFSRVMPPDPAWMESRQTRQAAFRMTKYLAEKDRLIGMNFAPDDRIASWSHGRPAPKQTARLEEPQLQQDGRWLLRGLGGQSPDTPAELVLITAQPTGANSQERIVALTAPVAPDNFFEREAQARRHPEQFFRWRYLLDPASLPGGPVTLRSYLFEHDSQRLRPIEGSYVMGYPRKDSSLTTQN